MCWKRTISTGSIWEIALMTHLYILIFGILSLLNVTYAGEPGCETGCPVLPIKRWYESESSQQLSCGTASSHKEDRLKRALPSASDLEPYMKHMPVKNQCQLKLCTVFAGVACAEFATNMQFSESELAVRVAKKRTKINKGYIPDDVLPYIVRGLIPNGQGIPYEKFQAWALAGVASDEYYATIEDAKRSCCPEISSDKILPGWEMVDDYVFSDEVTLIKTQTPIGFWRDVKLDIFELFTTAHTQANQHACILRIKEILQHTLVFISMHNVQEYDLDLKKVNGVDWWDSIADANGEAAKINLYPDHLAKMKSGELVVTGGHSVCLCGYDDAKGAFKFRNSWGTTYANNGYGYIGYKVFELVFPGCWLIKNGESPIHIQEPSSHVYRAYVVLPVPDQTVPYSSTEIKEDRGKHRIELNEMLMEFKQRRSQRKL